MCCWPLQAIAEKHWKPPKIKKTSPSRFHCCPISDICFRVNCWNRRFFLDIVMLQSMLAYKNAVDVTYSHAEQMSTLVEAAGKRCNIYSLTLYAPKLSLQKWTVRTSVRVGQLPSQERSAAGAGAESASPLLQEWAPRENTKTLFCSEADLASDWISVYAAAGGCVTSAGARWRCWAWLMPVNATPHLEQVRRAR